MEIVNTFSISS